MKATIICSYCAGRIEEREGEEDTVAYDTMIATPQTHRTVCLSCMIRALDKVLGSPVNQIEVKSNETIVC